MSKHAREAVWTTAELNFIDAHPDMSKADLADALLREPWEITSAVGMLRSKKQSEPWTIEEDAFLLATRHLTARQVAAQVGRTYDAVTSRRKILSKLRDVDFGYGALLASPTHIGARPLIAKTCPKCGLLLASEWFAFRPARGTRAAHWRVGCKKCVSGSNYRSTKDGVNNYKGSGRYRSKTAESRQRLQDITISRASRSREVWLEADHEVLRDPDLTLLEKALKLGRTYNATACACSRSGYKSHVGLGSAERDQWYIDNPNAKDYAA